MGITVAAVLLIFVTVVLVPIVLFTAQTVEISLVVSEVRAPLVPALIVGAA